MSKTRVTVVDDAVVIRRLLTDALGNDQDTESVGGAANGTVALKRAREIGGRIVVQDEVICIVWGMPCYVAEAGIAQEILPLKDIAGNTCRRVKKSFDASKQAQMVRTRV